MQKFLIGMVAVIVMVVIAVVGSGGGEDGTLLRLHIRANSNSSIDQSVKYEIKDEVVKYLTPFVADITSFDEAKRVIGDNLDEIKVIADRVLKAEGFEYESHPIINNEYFPVRSYEGYVVESGYYDALIIELGEAKGDNWWCVVYPPLCFVNSEYTNGKGVVYKSKIVSIIQQFINNGRL